jgi:hypothetical protein
LFLVILCVGYVTTLYRALLAREPDPGGLAGWVGFLGSRIAEVENGFIESPEGQARLHSLLP